MTRPVRIVEVPLGPPGPPGPVGPPGGTTYFGDLDGGSATSFYGGIVSIDGGTA